LVISQTTRLTPTQNLVMRLHHDLSSDPVAATPAGQIQPGAAHQPKLEQAMKTLSALIVLTTLLAVGILPFIRNAAPPTPSQHFIGLGDLPGGIADSAANGVSADGTAVVGYGNSAAGMEAFYWTRVRGMEGLSFPKACAISADGSMVVGYRHIANQTEPVRWTHDGGTVCLGRLPDHKYGSAIGVSADGSVIVGTYSEDNNDITFRWIPGRGIAGLPGLPAAVIRCEARAVSADGAVVVGESRFESDYDEAFRFHADTGLIRLGVVPGDSSSVADGVSADGSVIVGSSLGADTQAFRWTQQTGMIGLGTLPDGRRNSRALGVSADGSIIVGQSYGEGGFEAFIWDAAHGMRSLRQVLVSQFDLGANLAGWKLQSANAVSADGSFVVGCGMNPRGNREAWSAYLGDEHRPVALMAAKPAIAGTRSHE
jgi:probable HAF family extracellular repeat protein